MFENSLIAIVQGITEFLPVSSSGHVAIAERLLGLEYSLFLVIWLHASSLLAVIIYYWKDIFALIADFFALVQKKENKDGLLAIQLLVATVITAVLGLGAGMFLADSISFTLVGVMLVITALMIFLAEYFRKGSVETPFGWRETFLVAIAQGCAVIPGLSRSGTTIAYLISAGIERVEAVRISFLLSIPAIAGSLVFGLSDIDNVQKALTLEYVVIFIVGFITSFVSIRLMNAWIHRYWKLFIPYCLVVGLLVIVFL